MSGQHFNDTWSAYRYGNKIKILYHKKCVISDKAFEQSKYDYYLNEVCKSDVPDWIYYDIPNDVLKARREKAKDERLSQSVSRTRAKIFELALCNPFEWFVTLTLDNKKRDRFDLAGFRKALSQFIRDENKKRPEAQKIEYLLIPEQHQDGAWHMHGLFMGLTDSDLSPNKHGYLDWKKYSQRFGFFSCSRIKSHEKCSAYITKYVTKDIKKSTKLQKGQHSYFASQGLERREALFVREFGKIPFFNEEMSQNWDFENDFVKICWADISDDGTINFGKKIN